MAAKRKTRAREAQLAFEALSIEGGLLSPEWLSKIAQLQAGTQAEADYRIHKGLNLRDEIGRYWRIAQSCWADFKSAYDAKADPKAVADRFVLTLFRDAFCFTSLETVAPAVLAERTYPIWHATLGGRVPVVIAPADSGLDTLSAAFGDGSRKRSAFGLAQEYLNAQDGALWGIASDGVVLRIVRDNASLTRPAWVEADLRRIFTEERYADFAALWLFCHETRFGREGQPVSECALEAWRSAGREEGTRAREHLRRGVEDALVALGQGFLSHADNTALRADLQNGALPVKDYFNQLLRLVYRLIFLLTVEERGLLHPEGTSDATKALYANGYGTRRLRERSVKRSAHDRFSDLWDATKVVCRGLAAGEPRLGLPALAGIFAANQCPALDGAKLENRTLLLAVFKLAWLRQDGSLSRVNWRDMGPEELGSVYESLLELVPQIAKDGRQFAFATAGETKGNARKTTGSYYTPDSLVQVLLDSALEPVIADTVAKNPGHAVEALLGLSIVDPACGSGHFLLAAARRLAAHVARHQANGTPSAAEYRHALRQVVGRCIFGVDLNPMAVELCKVGLWMEAVEPGLPLTFLNSHIQHGNALLGTTPELMAKGIPDAAWDPIEGDDKKTASALKKRNKKAAEGQRSLDTLWSKSSDAETQTVTCAVAELDAASDANVEALAKKEERWDGILGSPEYRHQKFVADAWCAAFVWPKLPGEITDAAPTNELWRQLRDGQGKAPALTVKTVGELADQYRFFHWHLQFAQVFAKGGFDVVLSNPPWDEVQFEETAWFASRDPRVSEASNAAERANRIAALETSSPHLFAEYCKASRAVDGLKHFSRNGGLYAAGAVGKLNTYVLFVERDSCIAAPVIGRVGCVVPTGLATDKSTSGLFALLMSSGRIRALLDFVNEKLLFPAIRPHQHFCLLTLGPMRPDSAATFAAFLTDLSDLGDSARTYTLSWAEVVALNPEAKTLSLFATTAHAEATRKLVGSFAALGAQTGPNTWEAAYQQGTFNTASASDLFRTRLELAATGYDVRNLEAAGVAGRFVPLFDSKLARQYEWRAASLSFSGNQFRKVGKTPTPPKGLADPEYTPEFAYWVPAEQAERRLGSWARSWLMGFKDVTGVTSTRLSAFAIVPRMGFGDVYPLLKLRGSAREHAFVLAWMNSLLVEFFLRQRMQGLHLTWHLLGQVPTPSCEVGSRACGWDHESTLASWIGLRVAELSVTSWPLVDFASELGLPARPFRYSEERRFLLRAEIDAAFFRVAGFSVHEASFALDYLEKVRSKDEHQFGCYRTKDVVLAMMADLVRGETSRSPYQTRLDPPPADPRVAHPPREGGKVIPLPVKPAARPQPAVAPAAAVVPDLAAVAASAWTRPHTVERGEIQAAILAVLKVNEAPMDRRRARLAALLCLEPHLLASMLDETEKAQWARVVGDDAKKPASAAIDATSQEWGAALTGLRGRERVLEDLQQNTWALGTGTEAIDTSGWPEGRAGFVVKVLRRLQQSTQVDAIILQLPTNVQQWLANAA